MRTKTVILIAAVCAAGAATSMAQVFSVNAVGYVNKVIPAGGFAMVSNPLRAATNTIDALFANVPNVSKCKGTLGIWVHHSRTYDTWTLLRYGRSQEVLPEKGFRHNPTAYGDHHLRGECRKAAVNPDGSWFPVREHKSAPIVISNGKTSRSPPLKV